MHKNAENRSIWVKKDMGVTYILANFFKFKIISKQKFKSILSIHVLCKWL